jgi:hypothetical protein
MQVLTIAGAIYAIFLPEIYVDGMIPRGYEAMAKPLKRTIRETMLVGNLGSCEPCFDLRDVWRSLINHLNLSKPICTQ